MLNLSGKKVRETSVYSGKFSIAAKEKFVTPLNVELMQNVI